jgi:disease resistance protein
MDDPTRRANLLEALTDAHPSCPDVPTPASLSWSEAQIRAWFAADGRPPLDVDGITPVPASTRPDGLWICQRIGCDAAYDAAALGEDANPPGACRHHPGAPVFHDGNKSWSCCGAKSHDFGEFMSIPGCARGRHTQVKPPKRTAAAPRSAPIAARKISPQPSAAGDARGGEGVTPPPRANTNTNDPEDPEAAPRNPGAPCPRCAQGFFCSDHAASAEAQANYVAPPPPRRGGDPSGSSDDVSRDDPTALRTCRNPGCGVKFREVDNADDACAHHPGPPVFHERKKGWRCCDRHAWDFDEFMRIPPCARGRHDPDPKGTGFRR